MKLDVEPGTPEWFSARLGRVTASLAAACLRRDGYMGPLAAFRQIMGITDRQSNEHMKFGKENEGIAREAFYELGMLKGWFTSIEPESFYVHDDYPWLGATPDGCPSDDSVLDIKCPTIHFPETLPERHEIQLRVQMSCVNRSKAHYFAWRLEGPHFHCLIHRDLSIEEELIRDLKVFYDSFISTGIPPPRNGKRSKMEGQSVE